VTGVEGVESNDPEEDKGQGLPVEGKPVYESREGKDEEERTHPPPVEHEGVGIVGALGAESEDFGNRDFKDKGPVEKKYSGADRVEDKGTAETAAIDKERIAQGDEHTEDDFEAYDDRPGEDDCRCDQPPSTTLHTVAHNHGPDSEHEEEESGDDGSRVLAGDPHHGTQGEDACADECDAPSPDHIAKAVAQDEYADHQ